MVGKLKNIKKTVNPQDENSAENKAPRYSKASYFLKKDRKAAEFIKKNPIPEKFLK